MHGHLLRYGDRVEQGTCFVALLDQAVLGCVMYYSPIAAASVELMYPGPTPPGAAYIGGLGVAPDGRGKGIGRALVDRCIATARDNRAKQVVLVTGEMMSAARALYGSAGFLQADTTFRFYNQSYYIYSLDLAP